MGVEGWEVIVVLRGQTNAAGRCKREVACLYGGSEEGEQSREKPFDPIHSTCKGICKRRVLIPTISFGAINP